MKKNTLIAAACFFVSSLSLPLSAEIIIDEHGFWHGEEAVNEHRIDFILADALADFFIAEQVGSVVDFGCGTGEYVKIMRQYGIDCQGYDGNPDTVIISDGIAKVADLSQPLDLGTFDWVMSLEVGEHLPKQFEMTYIENLDRHNTKGIVLSWALKGQGGFGHFNEQSNAYVKDLMKQYGYVNDEAAENILRTKASFWWFKNTIMVFRRG